MNLFPLLVLTSPLPPPTLESSGLVPMPHPQGLEQASDSLASVPASLTEAHLSCQVPHLNQNAWNNLEKYSRSLTRTYQNVYVCTGPLFLPR